MVFKTLPIAPLETIYEEATSRTESRTNSYCDLNEETHNGLISARSIPSVDIERQRIHENKKNKLPIEVQFRDGSKRFIHPTTTPTMFMNRRNLLNSTQENFSPVKFFRTKRPLVVTIITADDLRQAGVTPTLTPSTSGSDLSMRSHSQASSPFVRIKSLEDINEALRSQSTITPVIDLPIQTVSSNNENEKLLTPISKQVVPIESQLSPSPAPPPPPLPPTTTTVIHKHSSKTSRSLFKPIPFNIQPIPIRPRTSSTLISKPNQSVQKKNVTYSTYYQPNITFVSYQMPTNSSTYSYNSSMIPPEKGIQLTSNLQSLLQTNSSNYQPYSSQYPPIYPSSINQPLSNYSWQTVHTNSFYDIPLLSKQYSNIPLGIVLPISQVQNQDFVVTHDLALQRHLLNAGLLPETIELYERVLNIATARQRNFS